MKSLITATAIATLTFAATACDRNPTSPEAYILLEGEEDFEPQPPPPPPPPPPTHTMTVMTRNVYLGADLTPITTTSSPEQIPALVGEVWNRVVLNDFPARADAIARAIQSTRPDVVGLQEIAKFRIQNPGAFLVGNPQAAATVEFDYLMLLLDSLQARGLYYSIASVVHNADIELPAITTAGLFD